MASGAAPGPLDTELFGTVLRVESKVFYLDAKQNNRGKYFKIAERGKNRPKSSVVVPLSGLPQFIHLFDFFANETAAGRIAGSRDCIVESKVFLFSAGRNDRGKYLRIAESGGGQPAGGSSIMIPAGQASNHLFTFKETLVMMSNNESIKPDLDELRHAGTSTGLDAAVSPEVVNLQRSNDGPVLSVASKHFFFEHGCNDRGEFLKIKEVSGNMKNLLVVPAAALSKFQEAIRMAMNLSPQSMSSSGSGRSAGPSGTA